MANPIHRFAARLPFLALAGVLLLALPAGAAANSNNPITQTGGMSAGLTLLGTSLNVDVTLDGVGNIKGVTLTPTKALNSTSTAKDVVSFASTDGKTKVTVRASGDRLSIKARSSLAGMLGKGSWTANVFGTGPATVPYTIDKDGDGNPTLSIGSITTPGLVSAAKVDPKTKTFDTKDKDGGWAWAFGGVTFTHDGFVKHLSISISVRKSDGSARLAIVLSGRDRQKLTGSAADLGTRTWSAKQCDGTDVSVKYHVTSNGTLVTLVYDGATGPGATEKAFDAKGFKFGKGKLGDLVGAFSVRFDKSGVGVVVALFKNSDGTYTLKVAGRSGFCGGKGGSAGNDGHHGWGWGGNGHRGDGNHKPKAKP